MKFIKMVWHFIGQFLMGIWDFIFFFFRMPYEEQSKKIKLDENDVDMRGPENLKTNNISYRANKVSKC